MKLKFVSMPRFVFKFVLIFAKFAFPFLLEDLSSFCNIQKSPAPAPRTISVKNTVSTTVFAVFGAGGWG